jgi:hypothetical protein
LRTFSRQKIRVGSSNRAPTRLRAGAIFKQPFEITLSACFDIVEHEAFKIIVFRHDALSMFTQLASSAMTPRRESCVIGQVGVGVRFGDSRECSCEDHSWQSPTFGKLVSIITSAGAIHHRPVARRVDGCLSKFSGLHAAAPLLAIFFSRATRRRHAGLPEAVAIFAQSGHQNSSAALRTPELHQSNPVFLDQPPIEVHCS